MTRLEEWLPSPALAGLVAGIVVLAWLGGALREAWLGDHAASDAVEADLARETAPWIRRLRVTIGLLLALGTAVLVLATVVRFAVLADPAPLPETPAPTSGPTLDLPVVPTDGSTPTDRPTPTARPTPAPTPTATPSAPAPSGGLVIGGGG